MGSKAIPDNRLHGLDAARGVLIAMGVVLHASNVFAPSAHWLVSDAGSHPFFDLLSRSIHIFRMPAFFWVSGFFCAMTFDRRGQSALVQSRFPRLVIPLVVSLLTVNVLQEYLTGLPAGQTFGDVLSDGIRAYHLWFLVNLVVYTAVAAIVLPRFSVVASWLGEPLRPGLRAALLIPVLTYGVNLCARASGAAYFDVLGMTSVYSLARYAPYFAVGALMHFRSDLRAAFLSQPRRLFLPALALALFIEPMTRGPASVYSEVLHLLEIGAVWVCVASLHALFHRTFQRRTLFTEIAADATYTVYLFHHVITIALALLLGHVALGAGVEFFILCTLTLSSTLWIHYAIIQRSRLLLFLFNGRWTWTRSRQASTQGAYLRSADGEHRGRSAQGQS